MIFVNADDWGRTVIETDAALECVNANRVHAVSAMVFMADSERAARIAQDHNVDVGLHLNLTEPFSGGQEDTLLTSRHSNVANFLTRNTYSRVIYHPGLAVDFRATVSAQLAEFLRLYGRAPRRIDGHHHQHLCANVLLGDLLPRGVHVRPNFHFGRGEKSPLNRWYRRACDAFLRRRYSSIDYFFALSDCVRKKSFHQVAEYAGRGEVELMTHPAIDSEREHLMSSDYGDWLAGLCVRIPARATPSKARGS